MISKNYITPELVPLVIVVGAALASKFAAGEAWAYIPRKRQDLNRRLPASWSILQTLLPAIGLLVGLLLAVSWMRMRNMPAPIAAYTIGSGATIAVMMLITLIVRLVVSKPRPTAAEVVAELLCRAAVVAALAYGYRTFTASGLDRLRWQDMAAGAVITLAVQAFWILWSACRRQKAAAEVA